MVGEPDEIHVEEVIFDEWNERHLAEHGVTSDDVKAVVANAPRFFRNLPGRSASHLMIGPDDAGTYFYLAFIETPFSHSWYPVTGWKLNRRRGQRLYNLGEQGGKTDD